MRRLQMILGLEEAPCRADLLPVSSWSREGGMAREVGLPVATSGGAGAEKRGAAGFGRLPNREPDIVDVAGPLCAHVCGVTARGLLVCPAESTTGGGGGMPAALPSVAASAAIESWSGGGLSGSCAAQLVGACSDGDMKRPVSTLSHAGCLCVAGGVAMDRTVSCAHMSVRDVAGSVGNVVRAVLREWVGAVDGVAPADTACRDAGDRPASSGVQPPSMHLLSCRRGTNGDRALLGVDGGAVAAGTSGSASCGECRCRTDGFSGLCARCCNFDFSSDGANRSLDAARIATSEDP